LVQSYCTVGNSHRNQLAYDFLMPIGVPLIAARSGVVVELVADQPDSEPGGPTLGTHNHVNIRHSDGTVGFYAHFSQYSILVEVGDLVAVGDTLGLSGNSGSSTPHLHFGVYRTWPAVEGDDLPVNFRNAQGALDSRGGLVAGVSYLALPVQ
jgi:murein DD-endopeptidase MepM/ murein hydrolase activator NlpD